MKIGTTTAITGSAISQNLQRIDEQISNHVVDECSVRTRDHCDWHCGRTTCLQSSCPTWMARSVSTRDAGLKTYEIAREEGEWEEDDGRYREPTPSATETRSAHSDLQTLRRNSGAHHIIHLVRHHLRRTRPSGTSSLKSQRAYIARVIDQIVANSSEHIQTHKDVLDMVVHVRLSA